VLPELEREHGQGESPNPNMAQTTSATQTSSSSAYVPGYVIAGKYALEAELGEGGMGVVWRARNLALDAPVAIKLIRADMSRDMLGDRLLKEARAAARLGHPSIVRVFDVGETETRDPFLVMELLNGRSLNTILLEEPLSAVRVVQLLLPIADALSLAHSKGFVHRDLKPDNIFIAEDDGQVQPKLLDFGIVKTEQRDERSKLTQRGTVLGSPDYMSPEQARGQDDIDFRSDIWSFCVTLYQAVSSSLPFENPNYNALLRNIVESPPIPLAPEECDAVLWHIVERGLQKDRAARFRSMGELGRALADWLISHGIYQDACGKSLEAKWGRMPSDPAGRSSSPWLHEDARNSRSGIQGLNADPEAAAHLWSSRRIPIAPRVPGQIEQAVTVQEPVFAGVGMEATERLIIDGEKEPETTPKPRAKRVWIGAAVLGAALLVFALFLRTSSSKPAATPSPAPKQAEAVKLERKPVMAPAPQPAPPVTAHQENVADRPVAVPAEPVQENVKPAQRPRGPSAPARPRSTKPDANANANANAKKPGESSDPAQELINAY
jgi:serine/threonine-protein kinase